MYWWENESVQAEVLRLYRLHVRSTRIPTIQAYLREQGYTEGLSTSRLRGRFSQLGWNREIADPWEEEGVGSVPTPSSLELLVAEEQLRQLNREAAAELQRTLSQTARWRNLLDVFKDTALAYDAIPGPRIPLINAVRVGREKLAVVALLSDLHAELLNDPADVGARLAYDQESFARRLQTWTDGLLECIHMAMRLGRVEYLSILGLGDWVHNSQMRPGANRNTTSTTARSVVTCGMALAHALRRVALTFPELPIGLEVLGGNHDRVGAKGEFSHQESWHVVLAALLAQSLDHIPQVTVYEHLTPWASLQIGNASFLAHHGHKIGGGVTPQMALERRVTRWAGSHGRTHDYVVLGHYHSPLAYASNTGAQVYVNGSFADSDDYSFNDLGLLSHGVQKVLILDGEGEVLAERNIRLGPRVPATIPEIRWSA